MLIAGNRKGPEVTYRVKHQGGFKNFERLEGTDPSLHARAFAEQQRAAKPGNWAEISKVTTEVVERRR